MKDFWAACSADFEATYGRAPDICCFAPGRVNLIGEHTDYNGGHVFPCAIHLGIGATAAKRSDDVLRFFSANVPEAGVTQCRLDELSPTGHWTDYPKSVILTFRRFGYPLPHGADIAFRGNLPDGSGLSSSAALEVVTGTLLRELYGISVTPQQIAVFGQFAENRFIGVNCGIMDQFASAMGKKDHAMLLDAGTLDLTYAPIDGDKVSIVIVNSGVKHSLAASAYNERRKQCQQAVAALSQRRRISSLCQLTQEEFDELSGCIPDEACRRRARHAVYENARTLAAVEALQKGDLAAFGRLMNLSHQSLRSDYEVTCPELDCLAEIAWCLDGVYGSRMTGGGFGGCTVTLAQKDAAETVAEQIKAHYRRECGREAQAYIVRISDGARRIL
jgi:galactokinase